MTKLAGKVAIITGAAQGIGAAFAEALAGAGAAVLLADLADAGPVAAAIRATGGRALAVRADVTDGASVAAMVASANSEFGAAHILVNNAAHGRVGRMKRVTDITSEDWHRLMAINVGGVFECVRAVVPTMRDQGYGKIINLASAIFWTGPEQMAHYVASKGAVIGFTRAIAKELGEFGIRANCLAPGLTLSPGVLADPVLSGPAAAAQRRARALGRDQYPSDLLGALLYLAGPDSDFVTGQTVVVDGGGVMH